MSTKITRTVKYICDGSDCDKSLLVTLEHELITQYEVDIFITQNHGWSIMNNGTTYSHYCHSCCIKNKFPTNVIFDVRQTL